jgi:hypothetical protein
MEWRLAAQYDPATRSADSWMVESQPTVKLRCAAGANLTTHRMTQSTAKQTEFCPAYRRHLQRLVRPPVGFIALFNEVLRAFVLWFCAAIGRVFHYFKNIRVIMVALTTLLCSPAAIASALDYPIRLTIQFLSRSYIVKPCYWCSSWDSVQLLLSIMVATGNNNHVRCAYGID